MDKKQRGIYCEGTVCEYLKRNGYSVISRNFRSLYGEIDIIARKGNTICAVEVKSVSRLWSIEDLGSQISPAKRARIKKTMLLYLAENPDNKYDLIRFDAAAVKGSEVTYLEGVF